MEYVAGNKQREVSRNLEKPLRLARVHFQVVRDNFVGLAGYAGRKEDRTTKRALSRAGMYHKKLVASVIRTWNR